MNWRWIVPAAFAVAAIEITCGIAAYNTKTWNLAHTEVITGWPAVREVCLIIVPLTLGGCIVFGALFYAVLSWAMRGDR